LFDGLIVRWFDGCQRVVWFEKILNHKSPNEIKLERFMIDDV